MIISLNGDHWDEIYDGYGNVNFGGGMISLKPKTSSSPSETHAALVLSKLRVKDFTVSIKAVTKEQLRTGSTPNPWEVFWIFFNYNFVSGGKKETNYFMLKTNGCELGSACGDTDQKFLATTNDPKLDTGTEYEYVIDKSGSSVNVSIDGNNIINFSDSGSDLYDDYGYIGLYAEDAHVLITEVNFTA